MKSSLNHLAIIMDGNGRWAKKNSLPRLEGHRRGALNAKIIIKKTFNLGINWLTLYAFSAENMQRSAEEVSNLIAILEFYLKKELGLFKSQEIRLHVIGDIDILPQKTILLLKEVVEETRNHDKFNLVIAFNYGSRQEIVRAAKLLCIDVSQGKLDIDNLQEETFNQYLYTHMIPNPDLVIRTSGELRLSNFLMWQIAYSELYFSEILWPDFSEHDLEQIIDIYLKRERRYGKA